MRVLREPLVHLLVLGALIFGASQYLAPDGEYRIEAGEAQRARLASIYRQQYGTPPTRGQLESLLEQYVRSEILYREGLALGLDRGDEIVRRRVVQKIEFLNQDATDTGADETRLRQYFREHQDRYADAASASFTHLYFSTDAGGEKRVKGRAELALQALRRGSGSARTRLSGDPFADGQQFESLAPDGIERIFGASFANAVFGAPVGSWSGPYRSGLGWHLVRINERQPSRPADFTEVRTRVEADFQSELRRQRNAAEFRRLAAKYHIVGDDEPS